MSNIFYTAKDTAYELIDTDNGPLMRPRGRRDMTPIKITHIFIGKYFAGPSGLYDAQMNLICEGHVVDLPQYKPYKHRVRTGLKYVPGPVVFIKSGDACNVFNCQLRRVCYIRGDPVELVGRFIISAYQQNLCVYYIHHSMWIMYAGRTDAKFCVCADGNTVLFSNGKSICAPTKIDRDTRLDAINNYVPKPAARRRRDDRSSEELSGTGSPGGEEELSGSGGEEELSGPSGPSGTSGTESDDSNDLGDIWNPDGDERISRGELARGPILGPIARPPPQQFMWNPLTYERMLFACFPNVKQNK